MLKTEPYIITQRVTRFWRTIQRLGTASVCGADTGVRGTFVRLPVDIGDLCLWSGGAWHNMIHHIGLTRAGN